MANRRPIRRFKKRFYGLKAKRPFRWLASTPEYNDEPFPGLLCTQIPDEGALGGGGGAGVGPVAFMAIGSLDTAPWADDQEVTIDRIVGSIALAGRWEGDNLSVPPVPYCRFGFIVGEELSVSPAAADPERRLFQINDLEEAEWMWLHQLTPVLHQSPVAGAMPSYVWSIAENIPVDLRVRRKLGPSDTLFFYASYMQDASLQPQTAGAWAVSVCEMLRIGIMSR